MSFNRAIGIGLAGAFAIGLATPSFAAPASMGASAIHEAAPEGVTDVRWGGRGVGAGIGLGLLGGAVIAGVYGPHYYGYGPYAYGNPAYAYYPGPYYGPRRYYGRPYWRHRRHWRHW